MRAKFKGILFFFTVLLFSSNSAVASGNTKFTYYGHGTSESESTAISMAENSAWWQATLSFHWSCETTSADVELVGEGIYHATYVVTCWDYI